MTTCYNKNLRLLSRKHPELYNLILDHKSEDICRVIPTPSGNPTILCLPLNGKNRFLHSPEDPAGEADKLLEGIIFRGNDITVLMGIGLGYLPIAITQRMDPDHRLFIVEASPEILIKACQSVDLSILFSDDRVRIFGAGQVPLIWDELERERFKVLSGEVIKMIHPPSRELFPESYREVEEEIERLVSSLKESFHTLEVHRSETVQNVLNNIPSLADATAVDHLFGLAEGYPALIVAAGPSLDKNIGQIKDVVDHFLIIAVDAALKPLVAEGILPHLMVSVDPTPINLRKFEQIPSLLLNQIPLVFSPKTYHEIPRLFSGTKSVFGEPNRLSQWSLSLRGPVAELPYAFSVAHHAFYLARVMGADPIIFVGLDLSFPMKQGHAKNCAVTWKPDLSKDGYPVVQDVHGGKTPTLPGFIYMISLFERELARTKARCIDATEGGALIRGTQVMTLREVIARWGQGPVPDFSALIHKICSENLWRDISVYRDGLAWLLSEATELKSCCHMALSLLKPVLKSLEEGLYRAGCVEDKIAEVNRIADRVSMHQKFTEIIKDQMANVLVDHYRIRSQLRGAMEEKERLFLEVQKSYLFFERLDQIVEALGKAGRPVLKQMEDN